MNLTKQQIRELVLQLRNERRKGANTKQRVANIFDAILDLMEEVPIEVQINNGELIINNFQGDMEIIEGDLIVSNFKGESIQLIDGELIIN